VGCSSVVSFDCTVAAVDVSIVGSVKVERLTPKVGFEQAGVLGLFGTNELCGGLEVTFILIKRCGDTLLKRIAVGPAADILPHGLHEQGSSVGPHEVGDGIQTLNKILRRLEMNAAGLI